LNKSKKLIFVSFKNHWESNIPGGVQVCTQEYFELLKSCGFDIEPLVVEYTSNYYKRLKIKLGVEVYDVFNRNTVAKEIINRVNETGAGTVALNQVDFIRLAPMIKAVFGAEVKVVILSHGNFSGDFLHEITRGNKGYLKKVRDTIRLGYLILTESNHFIHSVDVVLCLSETERQINNWLGCPTNIFIPRMLNPVF
jgi:hypothetical protein